MDVLKVCLFLIGIPEGDTVYVLRMNKENPAQYEIWNALEGECYYFENKVQPYKLLCFKRNESERVSVDKDGVICPLKAVDCIIGNGGIWINE